MIAIHPALFDEADKLGYLCTGVGQSARVPTDRTEVSFTKVSFSPIRGECVLPLSFGSPA